MVRWRKQSDPRFSIRKATAKQSGCSPALVTQVIKGKRRLTRDRVPQFAAILALKKHEELFLDRWVVEHLQPKRLDAVDTKMERRRSSPQNHLLSDWLNVYVKDLCGLKGSRADVAAIHRALSGVATPKHIERSLKFLLKHGYLRRTIAGGLIKNELLTQSTDGPPSEKIRKFHKRSLEIARRGIDIYPPDRRRASALVMSLTDDKVEELRELLKEFYERLMEFTEKNSEDSGKLHQVLLHLTPIGSFHD